MLSKRLIIVTGKGGVGKSTVAAALGTLAARRGLRTIIAEVSGRGDIPRLLGASLEAGHAVEQQLSDGLYCTAIDPELALEEYLIDQLPVRRLASLLASSKTFTYLAAATPGLRELMSIGKVWELAQPERRSKSDRPYDLVIVDAPATGHGVAFLQAPRTFAAVAQVGPVARLGTKINDLITNRVLCGVVAVCTPQEAAVTEALELGEILPAKLGIELAGTLVNGVHHRRLRPKDKATLRAVLAGEPGSASARAIELMLEEDQRVLDQRAQLRRLPERLAELPFLYAPSIDRDQLQLLVGDLEGVL